MTQARTPISFIASDDPSQAETFYKDILCLTLVERSPFALVFDDAGHMLRVQIVESLTPAPYTSYGWQVADIEQEIAALSAKGATFQKYAHLPQNDQGVWTTPDGAKIAWFTDPSGNILSLTQPAVRGTAAL